MTTRTERNLKGPVRRIETEFVAFEVVGGKPAGTRYESAGYEIYDREGRLLEETAPERMLMEGVYRDVYIYDGGRLVERDEYDEDGNLIGKTRFNRDGEGSRIERHFAAGPEGKLTPRSYAVYDREGNFREKAYYDEDGRFDPRHSYVFEPADDRIVRTELEEGYQTEEFRCDEDGSLSNRIMTVYDSRGNIREYSLFEPDGTLYLKDEYRYEFDRAGNWIRRTQYHWTSGWGDFRPVPLTETRRRIEYF